MAKEKNIKDTVLLFVKNNSTFMIFAVIFIFASLRYEEFFTYNFIKKSNCSKHNDRTSGFWNEFRDNSRRH